MTRGRRYAKDAIQGWSPSKRAYGASSATRIHSKRWREPGTNYKSRVGKLFTRTMSSLPWNATFSTTSAACPSTRSTRGPCLVRSARSKAEAQSRPRTQIAPTGRKGVPLRRRRRRTEFQPCRQRARLPRPGPVQKTLPCPDDRREHPNTDQRRGPGRSIPRNSPVLTVHGARCATRWHAPAGGVDRDIRNKLG
jgi:hypothetical protein